MNKIGYKIASTGLPWVQWLRIHLPMQGILFQSLFQEDSTGSGATMPVDHSC